MGRLDDWTDVELFKSSDPPHDALLVPTAAVDLDGLALPRWLLVRVPPRGAGATPIRVVRARSVPGVAGQTAIKANAELLDALGAATDVPYPPARIRRASRRARLRYDRGHQASTAVIALLFAGGAFAVVEAATDSTWSKLVVAVLALVAFVGQQFARGLELPRG